MTKPDYGHTNHTSYLIEKIKISNDSEKEPFPHKQEFRLALHEIYFSGEYNKMETLTNTLANYYSKKNGPKDYSEAFKESLATLDSLSKNADEFYNFKNKGIQEFYRKSVNLFKKVNLN
ncbi:MAG: hypothetical protein AABX44_00265 [Nanoarchaeota archaeon]